MKTNVPPGGHIQVDRSTIETALHDVVPTFQPLNEAKRPNNRKRKQPHTPPPNGKLIQGVCFNNA